MVPDFLGMVQSTFYPNLTAGPKCKLDCESANIDCVTNLPKLMKMMDEVHIFIFYFS